VSLDEFITLVTERLMTSADLKAQITTPWEETQADVGSHVGNTLLEIAPARRS
jgi:hypothetical protein